MFFKDKHNYRDFFLHSAQAAFAAWLLLFAANSGAQGQQPSASGYAPSPQPESEPQLSPLSHVVHVVGLEEIKTSAVGGLTFDKEKVLFSSGGRSVSIPLRLILGFSIAHGDVALISGAKGTLAGMAPYGVGQVITAIRPSADTLTLLYRDTFHAIHGCVLILPKGAGDKVITTLAEAKISPSEYPKSGQFGSSETAASLEPNTIAGIQRPRPSVEVALLTESVDGIPSAFPIAEYEELVSELTGSGLFTNVWRQGDARRTPDALVLHINVEGWKKGSARSRGLVPFTGATVMKTHVALVDLSGRTVFQSNVEGTKRMRGESLGATNGLAKKVRKELQKTPELRPSQ